MASEPHPDAQAMLDQLAEAPGLHTLPIEVARAAHRDQNLPQGEPEAVAAVENVVVRGEGHGIPVRLYRPAAEGPRPVLVWAHGGGFALGDVDTEDVTARAVANATECVVASVDYRLAPEHPFPAALRDVYDVTEWAAESADAHGGDTDRVAVGGTSAGAALAAGVTLLARDQAGPDVDYQVLVCPEVAYEESFPSHEAYDGYFLTSEMLQWFDDLYFDDPLLGNNPYASPLVASSHADLPPATVVTAGFDPLQDEGEAYADALADDGVAVERHHYDDMIHPFFDQLQEPEWERAREAVADVGGDVRSHFA